MSGAAATATGGPTGAPPGGGDEGARVLAPAGPVRGRAGGRRPPPRARRPLWAALAARRRSARAARARLAAAPAPAVGHLRQRPVHDRRPVVPLLRADRVVPVHAGPRDRRRPRRR